MEKLQAIIKNGKVDNVIVADSWPDAIDITNLTTRPGIGWSYSGGVFTAPTPEPGPTPVEPPKYVTRLAFDNRFTQTERITLDLAGDKPTYQDPENATETRAQFQVRRQNAAGMRDMRQQVNNATFIDLARADTRAGVQQLEAMGLLAAGRALIILDTPIQDTERYKG